MASSLSTGAPSSEIAERIARVAARLFATDGYDATSVRHIVEAAAVTKPTLYYHFVSKEGLARALLTAPIEKLADAMLGIITGSAPATQKLVDVIEEHFKFCREDPDRARFAFAMIFGPRSCHLSSVLAEIGERLAGLLSQAVCCLADEGVIERESVDACTVATRGLIVIYTLDYLFRDLDFKDDLAQHVVRDLLSGFGHIAAPALDAPRRN